jgi:hypothetical protein
MNKFKQFREYCELYQKFTDQEKNLRDLGVFFEEPFSETIDGAISLIPELLFNIDGVDLFWSLMMNINELNAETIEELWNNLQEYQL